MNSGTQPEVSNSSRRNPLVELVLARLREFYREPAAIFWVYGFPLLMVVALGIAFRSRPVQQVTVDVQDGSQAVWIQETLDADERFRVKLLDEESCRLRLRTGKTDVVIRVNSTDDSFEYLYDPTKPGSLLAKNMANDFLQRAKGRGDIVEVKDIELDEPGGRYIDFLIPGLIGMNLMGGGLWGVGFAIVDMRIRKLLKRFLATPMKRTHFLASVMISRLLFTIPEVLVILIFARYAFGVVCHGSYAVVVLLIILGAIQFAGIGLLIGCRAGTLETVSGLMNLAMLPMWIASGIFFATDQFPAVLQPAIDFLPLTPLIRALRSVMLEDASIWSLGTDITWMLIWAVVSFLLALRFFKWN